MKKVEIMLKAFKLISEKVDHELCMVGTGPERKMAINLVKELKLKNVTFLENIPDVEKILGKASLYLLSSEIESFGLTVLEAISCETPVVASKVGGNSRFRVSNNFSALRAALATSCKVGMVTSKTANKLKETRNKESPSQNKGSIIKNREIASFNFKGDRQLKSLNLYLKYLIY